MQKLKKGSNAIQFEAYDINGKMIRLKSFKGKKTLISFFRKAACPFCNMGLQALIKNQSDLEKNGVQIITLFASPKEDILKHAGKQNPPFPIIPDADFNIYTKYGVEVSYLGMIKSMLHPGKVMKAMTGGFFSLRTTTQDPVLPANFLIDENQTVAIAHYGKDYDDHLPITTILNWSNQTILNT